MPALSSDIPVFLPTMVSNTPIASAIFLRYNSALFGRLIAERLVALLEKMSATDCHSATLVGTKLTVSPSPQQILKCTQLGVT